MGHLQPSQKVAMTTRFVNKLLVQDYMNKLEKRELQVLLVVNQTRVQDFFVAEGAARIDWSGQVGLVDIDAKGIPSQRRQNSCSH
jgi:hypothetical protein